MSNSMSLTGMHSHKLRHTYVFDRVQTGEDR